MLLAMDDVSDKKMDVDEVYVRNVEEIEEACKLAVIEESELKKISQVLVPVSRNFNSCYRLMELDDNLLKVINEGTRGNKNESAVLCTSDKTFEIQEVESSNTHLLVSNAKFARDIDAVGKTFNDRIIENIKVEGEFHTYLELSECKPRFDLLTLLGPSSFKGLEYEKYLDRNDLYDWHRLQGHIQASDNELRQAISTQLIANLDGYFRLIPFEFEASAVTLMLDVMDDNSWAVDEIDKEETSNSLKDLVPLPFFDLIFHKYTQLSEKKKPNGENLYRYNEEKTCKFLAQVLLAASPQNDYNVFMESWRTAVPENMTLKENYLSGIALISFNPQKMKKEVVSFPESSLSENIVERLNELFKVRDKWTLDEITPYVTRCTTRTADVKALLTRYARSTTVNGIKYYSSKHGK